MMYIWGRLFFIDCTQLWVVVNNNKVCELKCYSLSMTDVTLKEWMAAVLVFLMGC